MTSISVALCTYNGASHLQEQLTSIAAQSRPPEEIVISDDGSRDGTLDLIESFARQSKVPVRLLPPGPRLGVTANFERALVATTGEFIALSDQDDVWRTDHLARLSAALLADRRVLLAHSDARLVDADGSILPGTLFRALRVRSHEISRIGQGRAFEVLLRRNLVTGATTMIRRSLLDLALPFEKTWLHDEWLGVIAASRNGVAVIDEPLIDYRQHGRNEVGARVLSWRQLAHRLTESDPGRLSRLADKWKAFADRAPGIGLDSGQVDQVRAKADFERARALDPEGVARRSGRILGRFVRGEYVRFASQRRMDALRDLLTSRRDGADGS